MEYFGQEAITTDNDGLYSGAGLEDCVTAVHGRIGMVIELPVNIHGSFHGILAQCATGLFTGHYDGVFYGPNIAGFITGIRQ